MNFLKNHWAALIGALFVSLVSVAPQLWAIHDSHYKGIQMFGTDAEYDYVGRINQTYSNTSSEFFDKEHGKDYYLAPLLGERIVGSVGRVVHLSAVSVNVASKAVFPPLLFLLVYGWLLSLFNSRKIAFLGAFGILLGSELLDPVNLAHLLSLKTTASTFLPYTRPINPQLSSVIMVSALWALQCLTLKARPWRLSLLVGLLIGLSLYVYVYTWTFLLVFTGCYVLYFLLKKDWNRVKTVGLAFVLGLLLALPFFLNLLRAIADKDYLETTSRLGLLSSRAPIIGLWLILGWVALIFLWPKKYNANKVYFLLLLGALTVVLNQQLVTGMQLQPGHFHWYVLKPIIIIFLVVLVSELAQKTRWSNVPKLVLFILGGAFALNGILVQINSYRINYNDFGKEQEYSAALIQLQQLPQHLSIFASPELSILINAYTTDEAPNTAYASQYLHSDNYLEQLLYITYHLQEYSPEQFREEVYQNESIVRNLYGLRYRDSLSPDEKDSIVTRLSSGYTASFGLPISENLRRLGFDAMFSGPQTRVSLLKK